MLLRTERLVVVGRCYCVVCVVSRINDGLTSHADVVNFADGQRVQPLAVAAAAAAAAECPVSPASLASPDSHALVPRSTDHCHFHSHNRCRPKLSFIIPAFIRPRMLTEMVPGVGFIGCDRTENKTNKNLMSTLYLPSSQPAVPLYCVKLCRHCGAENCQ